MRFVQRSVVLAVMLLALAFPLVTAAPNDACAILSGVDYTCLPEEACEGCSNFQSWCLTQGGTLTDGETDPACVEVCCCDGSTAIQAEVMSRHACSAIISGPPSCLTCQFKETPIGDNDCEDVCGGSGGTTGFTHSVDGYVYDWDLAGVPAARIQYPVGSTLVTVFTDANGYFSLLGVPEGTINFKASRTGCGADFSTELVDMDLSITFDLDCRGGCSAAAVSDTIATPVAGSAAVDITWTPTDCGAIQGYLVERCAGSDCRLVGYVEPGTGSARDTTVEADTEYCYTVSIVNEDGDLIPQTGSDQNCVAPMDEYCLEGGATLSTCFNEENDPVPQGFTGTFTGSAHCNASNQFMMDEQCAAGQACFIRNRQPTCGPIGHCELCNGPFGWFIDHAAKVLPGDSNSCEAITGCVLNNDGFAEDTYQPCNEIRSCYDYHTRDACEKGSGYDACGISATGCEWTPVPDLEEIGKGVCTDPSVTAEAPCTRCTELFGFCNEELCEVIVGQGDRCYYNEYSYMTGPGGEPSQDTCVPKEEMACRYYDNPTDCENGRAVSVDVIWTAEERTAGTHALTASTDMFSFGTCAWINDAGPYPAQGGYCVKNANARLVNDGQLITDDCREPDVDFYPYSLSDCYRDNQPPVTTIPFSEGSYLDLTFFRKATIGPIVNDDTFPPDTIESFFCMAPSGTDCGYPSTPWNGLVTTTIGAQAYTIKYYSVDPAGNLEPVKSIDVNIQDTNETILLQALLI